MIVYSSIISLSQGEFVKFDLLDPLKILQMFRKTKKKLTNSDIQIVCCLFNSCGKYMFHHPKSHHKTKLFLESLFKVKSRIPTERHLCALIDEAYYHIFPADKEKYGSARSFTFVERFFQHIIWNELRSENVQRVSHFMGRLLKNLV